MVGRAEAGVDDLLADLGADGGEEVGDQVVAQDLGLVDAEGLCDVLEFVGVEHVSPPRAR